MVDLKQKAKEVESENKCEHEYKKFKQTIRTTNDKFPGTAYFIVQGCIKCKDKKILDYVVEK